MSWDFHAYTSGNDVRRLVKLPDLVIKPISNVNSSGNYVTA